MLAREIDRITPTFRPSGLVVGRQRWRDLLFLHWPVPVEALRPLIPRELEIDTYEGAAYIGLVPFWMTGVRPGWAPERSAFRFLETNVRTYVHRDGRDPGVYFFSLEAGSAIAVAVARLQFGLPYYWAKMQLRRDGQQLTYRTRRLIGGTARSFARFEPGEYLGPSRPGTLEHFLIERYYLHVQRNGEV
ncbi:MAG: YqjF family protein, partial [Chloroflexota bacterium]